MRIWWWWSHQICCWCPPDKCIAAGQAHLGKVLHDDLATVYSGLPHQQIFFWREKNVQFFRWVPTCLPQRLSRSTCTPHPLPPQHRFIFHQIYCEYLVKVINISHVIFSWHENFHRTVNFSRTLWLETMPWLPTTFETCPPRSQQLDLLCLIEARARACLRQFGGLALLWRENMFAVR